MDEDIQIIEPPVVNRIKSIAGGNLVEKPPVFGVNGE
jgi:hypothetical protein